MRRLLLLLLATATTAQAEEPVLPVLQVEHRAQLWMMSTFDAQADATGTGDLHRVTPRADVFVRRGRIRLAANLPRHFTLLAQLQYDGLAQDTGTLGRFTQPVDFPVRVRDAFLSWEPIEGRLELQAGYFPPRVSREAHTSAFDVLSFEKSDLQTYVRRHVFGDPTGRVAGVQVTALTPRSQWQLAGTLGVHDPSAPETTGEGIFWSPLVVGRVQVSNVEKESVGDPFKRLHSLTVGIDGSWQAGTDVFRQNGSFGGDLAWRWGPFALVAEGHGLVRADSTLTLDSVWLARAAWAFAWGERFLQPVVTVTRYVAQAGGRQTTVEAALRALLTDTFSVGLALNWSEGRATSLFTDDRFFRQGSWIALGLQHEM